MHKNASINTTGNIIISNVSNLYLGSFFIGVLFEVSDSILMPTVGVLAVLFELSAILLPALAVLFEPSAILLPALAVLFELSDTLLFAFAVISLSEFIAV